MNFQRLPGMAIALALLFPPVPADGQFSATVNVGLDDPTRQLIENFVPQKLQDAAIATLKEALPLLKTNFDAYLLEVNNTVEKQILNGQCAATGLSDEFRDQITKIFKYTPGPIEEFRAQEAKALTRLRLWSGPQTYSEVYVDLYYKAAVAYCRMNIAPAPHAREIENHYRQLAFMWWRTAKSSCSSPNDCAKTVRTDTQRLIDTSDKRDVEFVQAAQKLGKVSSPSYLYEAEKQLVGEFDPEPYNDNLEQLLGVQDQVLLAKARREYMAAQLVEQAQKSLADVDTRIANAQRILKPLPDICAQVLTPAQIQRAQPEAAAADAIFAEIGKELSDAITLDAANQTKNIEQIRRDDLTPKQAAVTAIKTAQPYTNHIAGCTIKLS
jgi:hypothetical protein